MGGKKKGKKGKKKKGGAAAWLKLIAETGEEAVIKETIMERITIEKLREGLDELEEENQEVVGDFHQLLHDHEQNRKMDKARMDEYYKELRKLEKDKDSLLEEIQTYNKTIEDLAKQNDKELKTLKSDHQHKLGDFKHKMDNLDFDLQNHKEDIRRQRDTEETLQKLKFDIKNEKKLQMIEVNEKERDKIQAIAKLRKEMQYKIKETKANLLALNDEQLQTTTRLTIL